MDGTDTEEHGDDGHGQDHDDGHGQDHDHDGRDDVTPAEPAAGIDIARRLLVAGAVLAVVGTVLALVLVQRIGTTYRDGLTVAGDAAEVTSLSSRNAADLAGDLSALAGGAVDALDEAGTLVELASSATDDVGTALATNLADGVEGTASIADGMAGFIEAVEWFIPGDSESLAEDLRALADGLEPVPDQLRSLGQQMGDTSAALTTAGGSLDEVQADLDVLAASIAEARVALAEVEALAADLEQRAGRALDRSRTDLWLMRVLVVVLGLGTTAACLAAHRALGALRHDRAGGGTRTHTPRGTGT